MNDQAEQDERLGQLKPKEKAIICIDMTDTCVQVCAAGIRQQNPNITEEELVERLSERLAWSKRRQSRKQ